MNAIVHVSRFRRPTTNGVYRYVDKLTQDLAHRSLPVELWSLDPGATTVVEEMVGPVRVVHLPVFKRRVARSAILPSATRRYLRFRRDSIAVFHLYSVFQPETRYFARMGLPYVIMPHGALNRRVIRSGNVAAKMLWMRCVESRIIRRAERICAVSAAEASEIRDVGIARENQIVVVESGIDSQHASTDGELDRDVDFLYIGRLDVRQKGLDWLLLAARQLIATGARPRVTIAGPDYDGGLKELKRLWPGSAAQSTLFLPPVLRADKEKLLCAARFFVQVSRWEGLSMGLLEAMSHGVPVVVTRGTNIAAEVEAHGAGVVAEDGVEGVYRALISAISTSEQEWRDMSVSARQLVATKFSWTSTVERMADLYASVLDETV